MNLFHFAVQSARDEFRVPQPETEGPRECCAEFAFVRLCDGDTDYWECRICGRTWTAPCPRPTV